MVMRYHIGTSGWHYDHWQHRFYPEGLEKAKWLEFYTTHFTTVELNNSFYRLPSETSFTVWRDSSPAGFAFAVKVSRFITHIKRLRNTQEAINTFMSRARILGAKLGPFLYQLPPNMHRDDNRLDLFLSTLPKGMEHVIEFRHPSWLEDKVFEILNKHNIGFCVFDMPSLSCPLVATADFAYIRFHGSARLYSSCYTDEELSGWAEKLVDLATNLKAMYIYFNNDIDAFAVKNAISLCEYIQNAS
jgi:uncharacterized protein YecE (DUF72 family)